ncbi:MAG: nuclear transport factor 2 family protein [Acidimicrobiales bacterium]
MGLTVEDQLAIQGLTARYNFAIDTGDGEAFAAAFVENGVLDAAGQVTEGRAALADYARAFAGSVRAPRHVITNLVIDGDGTFATLKAYLQLSIMSGEPPQSTVLAIGGYDDTLSKEDGTWRFVRRVFTIDS